MARRRPGPKRARVHPVFAMGCGFVRRQTYPRPTSVPTVLMIVALTGQKGGVGKSTVAVNLAAEALARGMSVLLVDADPQATARTWGATAAKHGHPIPTIVAMGAEMNRPDQLPRLAGGFDLVVIDCPARSDDVQRAALLVADLALLPCGPAAFDAWALAASLQTVGEARVLRPALDAAVIVTRKQKGTALGEGARDVLAGGGLPLLATELGYRVAYQEAAASGQAVSAYAPRSEAAREVRQLLDDVLARARPLASTPPSKGRPAGRRTPHGQEASVQAARSPRPPAARPSKRR